MVTANMSTEVTLKDKEPPGGRPSSPPSRASKKGSICLTAVWSIGTNSSQDLSPHLKVRGGYHLLHQDTELGGTVNCHLCLSPLPINSGAEESPTPLRRLVPEHSLRAEVRLTLSNRNFSTLRTSSDSFLSREVTFHVPSF